MRLGHLDNGHLSIMTYKTELSHDDFVLLLDTLRKAQEEGLISWRATDMVCENTKVVY